MDMILQGIPRALCYLDDFLIVGKIREEQISTLEEVLKRFHNGLKLSKDKCFFGSKLWNILGSR